MNPNPYIKIIYRVFQNPAPPSRAQVAEPWVKSMIVGWSTSNLKLKKSAMVWTHARPLLATPQAFDVITQGGGLHFFRYLKNQKSNRGAVFCFFLVFFSIIFEIMSKNQIFRAFLLHCARVVHFLEKNDSRFEIYVKFCFRKNCRLKHLIAYESRCTEINNSLNDKLKCLLIGCGE